MAEFWEVVAANCQYLYTKFNQYISLVKDEQH
jgi:hypothetical protein